METSLSNSIRFVCISDTHNAQPWVPSGDVLIHAGDLTQHGTPEELRRAVNWISSLPHPIKIVIAGNHDMALEDQYTNSGLLDNPAINWKSLGITYLEHEATKITVRGRTLTVFGSPYTPEFGIWAFQYPPAHLSSSPARRIWEMVPRHTDILITHGPPLGHLDRVGNQNAGCPELLRRLQIVRPLLHVFGHIHEGKGRENLVWKRRLGLVSCIGDKQERTDEETLLLNASIRPGPGVTYTLLNEPEVIDL